MASWRPHWWTKSIQWGWFLFSISPLAHLTKCILFAPRNFTLALFPVSLGTAVIPRRNGLNKAYAKFAGLRGRGTRCIMGDVQMANYKLPFVSRNFHSCWSRDWNRSLGRFQMTPHSPYCCPKTLKRRPCWSSKPMLRELNLFWYKTFSFVLMNLHSFWPPKGKPSIYFDSIFISGAIFFLFVLGHGNQMVLYD